jgi:tetratricopeptide (TPR) repeat protein
MVAATAHASCILQPDKPTIKESIMVAWRLHRRTFLSLFLLPVLPTAAFGDAQQEDGSPTGKLRTASDLLTRGIRYERAAELCREALKDAPDNWQIAGTLGCALAARAASLAYAAAAHDSLHSAQRQYQVMLRVYQIDREHNGDKAPPRFVSPAAEIHYKDDEQPYRLPYGQLAERMAVLTKDARAAFEQARASAKTPVEKAEAAHLQGWGLRLLHRHGMALASLFPDFPATPEGDKDRRAWTETGKALWPTLTGKEAILQAFEAAVKDAPENAAYWESLGDTYAEVASLRAKAVAACEKSLALESRNARLWYRLFQWRVQEPSQRKDVSSLLRNAARYEPGNTWYGYEEAVNLTSEQYSGFVGGTARAEAPAKQAEQDKIFAAGDGLGALREAVKKIEQTNAAVGRAVYPAYRPPVPPVLSAAWTYRSPFSNLDFEYYSRFTQMARAIAGYADYLAHEERNLQEAERACVLLSGCGEKLAGDHAIVRDIYRDRIDLMISESGDSLAAAGYGKLAELLRQSAPERAAAVEAKLRVVKDRVTARQKQLQPLADSYRFAYLTY